MKKDNPLWDFARYLVKVYKSEKAESRAGDSQKEANEKEHKAKELELIKSSNKVNRMLSALTLAAVCISGYQAYLSKVSIDAANHALAHQKSAYTADSIQRINDRIKQDLSDAQDDSVTKQNQTLQRLSVNAQIDALNAAKDQFNRLNESFLEIKGFTVSYNGDDALSMNFNYANYGKPVFVYASRLATCIGGIDKEEKTLLMCKQELSKRPFIYDKQYISEGSYPPIITKVENVNFLKEFKTYLEKPYVIYMCGEVRYMNVIMQKPMLMKFIIKTNTIKVANYNVVSLTNEIDK